MTAEVEMVDGKVTVLPTVVVVVIVGEDTTVMMLTDPVVTVVTNVALTLLVDTVDLAWS